MSTTAGRINRSPILISGMPRSGTTWLARLLSTAPGTALTGREPMNPRGRQFALGGTLAGWASLTTLTPRQRFALNSSYQGLQPLVYSRYGRRQWAAPLPWTRVVVKDPFAMLSLPLITSSTRARGVLLYRHPGAALASYQRMGWAPDCAEIRPVVVAHNRRRTGGAQFVELPPEPRQSSDASAMGHFWNCLYAMALNDIQTQDADVLVISHEELAIGGVESARRLFDALELGWSAETDAEISSAQGEHAPAHEGNHAGQAPELHRFGRDPRTVATSWKRSLSEEQIAEIESVSADVLARLDESRFHLGV